jgi:hypothetical protein
VLNHIFCLKHWRKTSLESRFDFESILHQPCQDRLSGFGTALRTWLVKVPNLTDTGPLRDEYQVGAREVF